jgi:hypothetical protein
MFENAATSASKDAVSDLHLWYWPRHFSADLCVVTGHLFADKYKTLIIVDTGVVHATVEVHNAQQGNGWLIRSKKQQRLHGTPNLIGVRWFMNAEVVEIKNMPDSIFPMPAS